MTQSTSAVQGGRRKRTDLIPTIPIHRGEGDRSPRSPLYGSSSGASSSRGSVNRSTGMSVSMSRLDQLSQPRRRLSQNQLPSPSTPLQPLHETETQQQPPTASTQNKTASNSSTTRSSRPTSRTHQTSSSTTTTASSPSSPQGTIAARGNRSMSKSMSHLAPGRPSPSSAKASTPIDGSTPPTPTRHGGATTTTRAERLRQKARQHASQRPQHGMDGVRRVSNGALKKTNKKHARSSRWWWCLSVCVQTAFPFSQFLFYFFTPPLWKENNNNNKLAIVFPTLGNLCLGRRHVRWAFLPLFFRSFVRSLTTKLDIGLVWHWERRQPGKR